MQIIYEYKKDKYRIILSGIPICMEDYCDSCGDCLSCNGEDSCYHSRDGEHFWVIYDWYMWDDTKKQEFIKSRKLVFMGADNDDS